MKLYVVTTTITYESRVYAESEQEARDLAENVNDTNVVERYVEVTTPEENDHA